VRLLSRVRLAETLTEALRVPAHLPTMNRHHPLAQGSAATGCA